MNLPRAAAVLLQAAADERAGFFTRTPRHRQDAGAFFIFSSFPIPDSRCNYIREKGFIGPRSSFIRVVLLRRLKTSGDLRPHTARGLKSWDHKNALWGRATGQSPAGHFCFSLHADRGVGQILLCMSGHSQYQASGEPVRQRPSDNAVVIPPDVKHPRSAAKDSRFAVG